MKINYAGIELPPQQKELIERLVEKMHESPHIRQLKVHIKEYRASGLRGKFDIHLEAMTDFGKFHTEGVSWLFNLAVKKAISRLKRQLSKHSKRSFWSKFRRLKR